MAAIFTVLTIPLLLLNTVGWIVAGIWLAILGEWGGIGIGILITMGGAFFCSILLLPGFLFIFPGAYLSDKGAVLSILGFIVMMLGLLWTYIVMTVWGLGAFHYFTSRATFDSWIPYLIWAYGIAAAPWAYMATKEQNSFSKISVVILEFASLVAMIQIGVFESTRMTVWLSFAGVMALGYLLNIVMGGGMFVAEMRMRRLQSR